MNIGKWRCVRIVDRFLRHDFRYRFDAERHLFSLTVAFGGKAGTMNVIIAVQEGVVNCLATFPFRGNEESAPKLAEFVCRVNAHLSFGHLDYDFGDGEVNFAYDLTFAQLKAEKGEALDRFFGCTKAMGEKFGPFIALLALGNGEPAALYEVAMNHRSDAGKGEGGKSDDTPGGKCVDEDTAPIAIAQKPKADLANESAKPTEEAETKEDEDGERPPVPVKNYTLEGLHVEGDFPIAKVESAARKYLSIIEHGTEELPDRPGFNILLSGVPGGGKSEFVNYLGQRLGRKVIVKMGSDILSRYVGDTEKSIREAFEEAEEENAILFLDEIDGVMQNRASAAAGWEVSQVNEILCRMEHFRGIMIGATNFRDNLDPAVLRRFTYKLEFGYLEPKGKSIFFDRVFKSPLTDAEKFRLDSIPNLTPGDFRTVSQSLFYLDDAADNTTRLAALEKESAMKGVGHKVCLGFSAR